MSTPVRNVQIDALLQNRVERPVQPAVGEPGFEGILADKLKVSGHAQTRLKSRQIELDGDAWNRVLDGVERAAQKGAKESLVMVDDIALVVSVRNRTVITAVEKERLRENVFTNIDSAVIV
ncbi:MAG: TIGR02530 family flagellar biosynthesis protein [Fimbriimonadaceae bacterium]